MEKVQGDMKIVDPFTDEQKKFFKKINIAVGKCNNTLKESKANMISEAKKEELY